MMNLQFKNGRQSSDLIQLNMITLTSDLLFQLAHIDTGELKGFKFIFGMVNWTLNNKLSKLKY